MQVQRLPDSSPDSQTHKTNAPASQARVARLAKGVSEGKKRYNETKRGKTDGTPRQTSLLALGVGWLLQPTTNALIHTDESGKKKRERVGDDDDDNNKQNPCIQPQTRRLCLTFFKIADLEP